MKKLKPKHYFPFSSEDAEIALNIMAEMRADEWYWQKRHWYLKERVKNSKEDKFMREFYKNLIKKVEDIRVELCSGISETFFELSKFSEAGEEIFDGLEELSNEFINNCEENEVYKITNQPFPLTFKIKL
tara:strand:- start:164 stop:553 length:390 start_codon:yes stop_codon:yes gene_type:complete